MEETPVENSHQIENWTYQHLDFEDQITICLRYHPIYQYRDTGGLHMRVYHDVISMLHKDKIKN